jgi:hypothetical protein
MISNPQSSCGSSKEVADGGTQIYLNAYDIGLLEYDDYLKGNATAALWLFGEDDEAEMCKDRDDRHDFTGESDPFRGMQVFEEMPFVPSSRKERR